MKVTVTGATGFVGRHLVDSLLSRGHQVIAVARDADRAKAMPWISNVEFISCDIRSPKTRNQIASCEADVFVHLAWSGLPNYQKLFHFEENLPASYDLLKSVVDGGCQQVLVTGTCFEYGLREGALKEDDPALPATAYGLAKDTLRRFLEKLSTHLPFALQWIRLFYLFGPGQSPNTLLGQLDQAIDKGEKSFNMSGGEQLRDYLHVEDVSRRLVALIEERDSTGIFNCCRGEPISVREMVENHIKGRGVEIGLNLGYYEYPPYEPMAFWGDGSRLNSVIENKNLG